MLNRKGVLVGNDFVWMAVSSLILAGAGMIGIVSCHAQIIMAVMMLSTTLLVITAMVLFVIGKYLNDR